VRDEIDVRVGDGVEVGSPPLYCLRLGNRCASGFADGTQVAPVGDMPAICSRDRRAPTGAIQLQLLRRRQARPQPVDVADHEVDHAGASLRLRMAAACAAGRCWRSSGRAN